MSYRHTWFYVHVQHVECTRENRQCLPESWPNWLNMILSSCIHSFITNMTLGFFFYSWKKLSASPLLFPLFPSPLLLFSFHASLSFSLSQITITSFETSVLILGLLQFGNDMPLLSYLIFSVRSGLCFCVCLIWKSLCYPDHMYFFFPSGILNMRVHTLESPLP